MTLAAADDDGRYDGAVELPEDGTWTVEFASTSPQASLECNQEMPAEPVTGVGTSDDDDPTPVVPLLIAGVFVGLLAALGVWTLVDRRRAASDG